METHDTSEATAAPAFVPGHELLAGWLKDNGIRASHFAPRIPVSQSQMSRILTGKSNTSDFVRVRIEELTGGAVPFASWRPVAERTEAA